jgi:hypothetical protein
MRKFKNRSLLASAFIQAASYVHLRSATERRTAAPNPQRRSDLEISTGTDKSTKTAALERKTRLFVDSVTLSIYLQSFP